MLVVTESNGESLMKPTIKSSKGFTLLEVIIVITLLAILAVAGMTKYSFNIVSSAEDSAKNTVVAAVRDGLQIYA